MLTHPFGKKKQADSIRIPNSARAESPKFIRGQRSITGDLPGQSQYSTRSISIPFVAAMAAALAGLFYLSSSEDQSYSRGCVDSTGVVVPNSQCEHPPTGHTSSYYPYRWHYGGSYRLGERYSGGSYLAPTSSTRGLFGGSGFHFGGGYS